MYSELLIGCGHSRQKRFSAPGCARLEFENLTTLDINRDAKPDIRWNLEDTPWPLQNDSFDEVHAYEVLEHLGRQGSASEFFDTFHEIWRVLRPGGYLMASCPAVTSRWLWGDPGHTRVIAPESLVFLDQSQYAKQCDGPNRTSMTDYRYMWGGDFSIVGVHEDATTFVFILKSHKPARNFT